MRTACRSKCNERRTHMLPVSCASTLLRLLHEIDVSLLLPIVAEAYRVARLNQLYGFHA